MKLLQHIRGYLQRPLVRPWALAGPVLVLMICLPLLQPLRQPDPRQWHDQQQMIAATVQAIAERHTLSITRGVFSDNPAAIRHQGELYSPYPPMLPLLLSPAYLVLRGQGFTYNDDLIFVQYLLTLIGAAMPVAMSAGLVYRLARVFELRRSLRAALGLAAIISGGVIAYGVALNGHAMAAFFLLIAFSCISHMAVSQHPYRQMLVASLAGALAAMAASVDPTALVFATVLPLVLLAMRWPLGIRIGGVMLYIAGAVPVVLLNLALLHAVGQSPSAALPLHSPAVGVSGVSAYSAAPPALGSLREVDDDVDVEASRIQVLWNRLSNWIGLLLEGLVGGHGILSHYPAIILGILGGLLVLHRNWTLPTKIMAAVSLLAGLVLLILYSPWQEMALTSYGAPWAVSLTPLLMLWAGVWLKRSHRAQSWVLAGVALAFSTAVSLVGMSNPMPSHGYASYSFSQAAVRLFHPPPEVNRLRQ